MRYFAWRMICELHRFFSVFSVGVQLLENDETLWCVSAWNDAPVITPDGTARSDSMRQNGLYFPGARLADLQRQTWDVGATTELAGGAGGRLGPLAPGPSRTGRGRVFRNSKGQTRRDGGRRM